MAMLLRRGLLARVAVQQPRRNETPHASPADERQVQFRHADFG
jgi:hypothetical protein